MIDDIYQVKSILGQGGSSRVLRWIDREETHYALKVIKNEKNFSSEKVEKMLFKEYYVSEILKDHPNILKCLNWVTTGKLNTGNSTQDVRYNVLEIAKNGSLSRFIRATGPLEEELAKFLFVQLASAVEHMHTRHIAHFDVKLENILLDEYYNIKLADFGSVEVMQSHDELFHYKKGTHWYMAPEVTSCPTTKKAYSPFKADVYSLGISLFLMLIGEFPAQALEEYDLTTNLSGDDQGYVERHSSKFSDIHTQNDKLVSISSDWIDLLNCMLKTKPLDRCSINEILQHPWLRSCNYNLGREIYEEFEARKAHIISNLSSNDAL